MQDAPRTLETRSPAETEALGRALARMLPRGSLVALRGDLATGKTCLVRGMASAFGAPESVHSPTFTLVNEYGGGPGLVHLDLYRIGGAAEAIGLGCEEHFEPEGVCAVEWAERAEALLPARRVDIRMEHAGGDARRIEIVNRGVLPEGWRDRLAAE